QRIVAATLISLAAPANHHDSQFLKPLIQLGQVIGLKMNIIVVDEAYGAAEETRAIKQEHGIEIVSPPRSKVQLPNDVDQETCDVFFNDFCDIPMDYLGKNETGDHEFKCAADPGQCFHSEQCPQGRTIPIDAGCFGAIPKQVEILEQVIDLRKNIERPFNLLKHREGLEPLRVRSQQGIMAVATFATMANLFLDITATRKTKKKKVPQMKFDIAA
ncbi:MAG: transposase, partial [Deltaproteobacteria bacterium]|nr:transposase [Deltaproteobacteria bacterium]